MGWWWALVVIGPAVATAVILVVVFGRVRRSIASASFDEVELDSGLVTMTSRFVGFRSARLIRSGFRRAPARAVLTASHLHLVERPQRYGVFERRDLVRFTVGESVGGLQLRSEDPSGATGAVEYVVPVADPTRWIEALVHAGARRAVG